MVGLGKMGANMTTCLLRGGHRVVAYDLNGTAIQSAEKVGAEGARTLDEVVSKLEAPRAVWVMVPAGDPTEKTIFDLAERLSEDDSIIDGGNSYHKDSGRRARLLEEKGLHFVDVGTSGGIWGLTARSTSEALCSTGTSLDLGCSSRFSHPAGAPGPSMRQRSSQSPSRKDRSRRKKNSPMTERPS